MLRIVYIERQFGDCFISFEEMEMKKSDKLFEKLVKPIEHQMFSIINRIIRDPDEARDVFQNVFEISPPLYDDPNGCVGDKFQFFAA